MVRARLLLVEGVLRVGERRRLRLRPVGWAITFVNFYSHYGNTSVVSRTSSGYSAYTGTAGRPPGVQRITRGRAWRPAPTGR